ncbi:MAG: DUF5689 domain-containing protein [Prevotella sp.]|nr:DUF5689 domain-containing protein [Prevotella sp.]MDY4150521.1 DUF5689 domain-containing protein [Prevotella sp.]
MKNIKYLLMLVLACSLFTGCMDDDWDTPNTEALNKAYGNQEIAETNVITIGSLKEKYESVINASTNSYEQITEDVQIKGRVVGNDIGGNIYNEVSIDDGTGAILICISQGGLFSYLPVGQEIVVDLKGLYIGGYGKQAEIGMPYTNAKGNSYVSRMSRVLWNKHFKLTGVADASKVVAEEFDVSKRTKEEYFTANNGKLMTIKNVEFTNADGKTTFAPSDEKDAANSVNRGLSQNGKPIATSSIVVRTSSYADFAAKQLPTGKLNITGVFTRYRTTWQILIRDERDIQPAE